ncbi:unnamed protein product [Amoebophrya sp. A25]|nr:unnamed protein product [Amoebophrya sp. A25]|eukprot:GSA25T00003821001.1
MIQGPESLGAPAQDAMQAEVVEAVEEVDLESGLPTKAAEGTIDTEEFVQVSCGNIGLTLSETSYKVQILKEGEHFEEEKKGKPKWCLFFAFLFGTIGLAVTALSCAVYIALLPIQCCCPGGEHTKYIDKGLGWLAFIPWTIAKCFWK